MYSIQTSDQLKPTFAYSRKLIFLAFGHSEKKIKFAADYAVWSLYLVQAAVWISVYWISCTNDTILSTCEYFGNCVNGKFFYLSVALTYEPCRCISACGFAASALCMLAVTASQAVRVRSSLLTRWQLWLYRAWLCASLIAPVALTGVAAFPLISLFKTGYSMDDVLFVVHFVFAFGVFGSCVISLVASSVLDFACGGFKCGSPRDGNSARGHVSVVFVVYLRAFLSILSIVSSIICAFTFYRNHFIGSVSELITLLALLIGFGTYAFDSGRGGGGDSSSRIVHLCLSKPNGECL